MDVLRPELVWVGNRCYRKNKLKESSNNFSPEELDAYEADEMRDDMYNDEVCDAGLDIEETSKGFRLKVLVPSVYNKYIIGKKGDIKRRLETETRTQIYVPKPGDRDEVIVINGKDRKGVISAKTRIDVLIDTARQHQPFTHFLSIPVAVDNVITGFENFKDDVLLHCDGDQGVDASIFQNPKKLHVTIGTLVLLSETEIKTAAALLESCMKDVIGTTLEERGLTVEIQGLEYMNDDPEAVDVLYAKIKRGEAADRLQILVDDLVDRFSSHHLMQREYNRDKLHVTVMNTLFRKDAADQAVSLPREGRSKTRESFDASGVLKTFGDYLFGSLTIPAVHLSQRFSTGQNQYYTCVAKAALPMS